jgi:anti-sigma factor RsiW
VTGTVPIADEELHAFIDGELPPDRAAVLRAALAAEPTLAARVAAYQADKSALRALFGPVAARPLPAAWHRRIAWSWPCWAAAARCCCIEAIRC